MSGELDQWLVQVVGVAVTAESLLTRSRDAMTSMAILSEVIKEEVMPVALVLVNPALLPFLPKKSNNSSPPSVQAKKL